MVGCSVFWGSHGCGLARGHPGHLRHICQDEEGPCSEIVWAQDSRSGLWVWNHRFWLDTGLDPASARYPALAFGEDLPADQQVSQETVDTVRAVRQSAGELPVLRDGHWVRAGDGSPWTE